MNAIAPAAEQIPRWPVLGFDFFSGAFVEAAQVTIHRALSGAGGYATLTGVHGLSLAQRDPAVASALSDAWLNFPDGVPVTWIQHRTGAPGAERVCGIDLMPLVLDLGQAIGVRHYLFGSTDTVLHALRTEIADRWPAAQVVGTYSPPFGPIDDQRHAAAIDAINRAQPHIVWIGLGAPKQDLWGQMYAPRLQSSLVMGVGAAFDYVSQSQRRAPLWMQQRGLEWLYRLQSEPRRLTSRYLRSNAAFAWDISRYAIQTRSRSRM